MRTQCVDLRSPRPLSFGPAGELNLASGVFTGLSSSLLIVLFVAVCLVESELIAQAQAGNGPIAHWTFDEGAGTVALDSSSNNNTGTIIGAVYVAGWTNTALSFNGTYEYVFAS